MTNGTLVLYGCIHAQMGLLFQIDNRLMTTRVDDDLSLRLGHLFGLLKTKLNNAISSSFYCKGGGACLKNASNLVLDKLAC